MDLLNLDPDTNFLIGILDLVPVYIYWKDSQGRILGCNKIQAEALGYKNKNDLIGKTDYDFYDKEKADAIAKAEAEAAAKKEQEELKKKWQEEAREAAKKQSDKAPIKFKDAVGRSSS